MRLTEWCAKTLMRCRKPRASCLWWWAPDAEGVAAIRLRPRTIDVVAELGRLEQRLLGVFPVHPRLIPGFSSRPSYTRPLARNSSTVTATSVHSTLVSDRSEKNTSCRMLSAARSSPKSARACRRSPRPAHRAAAPGFRLVEQRTPKRLRQSLTDPLQIIARIGLRKCRRCPRPRLAIAQVRRAREHVHLRAASLM